MPLKRLKHSAAIAGLLIAFHFRPGCAEISYTVKAPNDLNTISTDIRDGRNPGGHVIYFASFTDVGQLKLDLPNPNMDSLVLKRADSLSTGVIRVDSTLLDLKRMPGPVVLRGLAFQLMNSKAALIAGSETNKLNRKLVIEDCSIYADSLETTFLSWLTDNAGSVEIRRSFIVSKVGKATARISVEGGTVILSNNLLNFAGSVAATVYKNIEISSNNINQTEFRFTGQTPVGSTIQPKISFKRNFISHPPVSDAIGAVGLWVLSQIGFDAVDTDVKENRLYNTWSGFDYQPGANNTLWNTNTHNLPFLPTAFGKPVTELWNWYTSGVDSLTGMQTGDFHRPSKYNVLPNDPPFFTWALPSGVLTAYFQTALFPREIKVDTSENFPVITQPAIRPLFPVGKALKFGAFRIDTLVFGAASIYGKPVLVAKDTAGLPVLQPIIGNVNDNPGSYPNSLTPARYFVLANSGNTPRGTGVVPGEGSEVKGGERLVFSNVTAAGNTLFFETIFEALGPDVRPLGRYVGVQTTASATGSLTLGTVEKTPPYWPDSVYWYVRSTKTLVKATVNPSPADSVRYLATLPYSLVSNVKSYFDLVEKLSVPKGDTTTAVAGGTLHTHSVSGFQMRVSDTTAVDTAKYGKPSKGFKFTWAGRGAVDSIILTLKASADQRVFVITTQGVRDLDSIPDTAGNYRLVVGPDDMDKTFFLAMKFNVFARVAVTGTVEGGQGVTLANFTSGSSGRLTFADLPSNFLESQSGIDDTLRSTRLLGGRSLIEKGLTPTAPFGMTFAVNGYKDLSKVEAWTYDGGKWHALANPLPSPTVFTGTGIPPETQIIVVVERLQAPENYVSIKPVVVGNKVTVIPVSIDSLHPVTGYCIDLQSVDIAGIVETTHCTEKPITDSTSFTLLPNTVYLYRIHYAMGSDAVVRPFLTLPGTGWDALAAFPPEFSTRAKGRWHLIGFPFEAPFYRVMKKGNDAPDTTKKVDTTLLVRPGVKEGQFHYDTIPKPDTLRVKPGQGFLFASSRTFTAQFDSISGILSARPFKMRVDTGWTFISNPYPTHLLKSRVRSNLGKKLTFFQLTYDSAATLAGAKKYTWDKGAPALRAYEGYAVHSDSADSLTFDPLADTATFAAKAAGGQAYATMAASLETATGASRMELSADPRESNIPFLPTPGSGPELRLGGRSGYLIKKVADLTALDEPVVIRMDAAGRGSFRLAFQGAGAPEARALQVRLIDLISGKIYDGAAAEDLPLAQGASAFRLLAGDRAFVDARTQAFLAGAPAEIGLSQNFPNPFRGRTRIALDWPAWQNGDRHAVLDVLDMQGRSVSRTEIGDIRVGRQVVTLDASAWKPGIYMYRLTVVTGGRQARLQKRMLVTP